MTENPSPQPAPQPPESDDTALALDLVTEGLGNYIDEIASYCSICHRHGDTIAVHVTARALHLVRRFPFAETTLTYIHEALAQLPSWQHSLFWQQGRRTWPTLEQTIGRQLRRTAPGCAAVTRGVSWMSRPVFVCVLSQPETDFLQVELLLLPVKQDLPVLPLRTVASGLHCHEHLVPDDIAQAVPTSPSPGLSIYDYLSRAMPENLFASKCFSLVCAEQ